MNPLATLLMSMCVTAGPPAIEITSVPDYATDGFLEGVVSGVDVVNHRVATYIQIEGSGWWIKPSDIAPLTAIDPDGTFSVDVVTGGIDDHATIFLVALVPGDASPPIALGAAGVPAGLAGLSLATDIAERYGHAVEFAGRSWGVKSTPASVPVGPGPNRFSLDPQHVFVDENDHLHLVVDFHDAHWWCAEVILLDRLGLGTYAFTTTTDLSDLDINLTFAGFPWDPFGDETTAPGNPNREFDVEDSRWGDAGDPTNAQFVVQPYHVPGNLERYAIPPPGPDATLTRFFTWRSDLIRFVALSGDADPFDFDGGDVIHEWVYTHDPAESHYVPAPGRAAFRFILWLNNSGGGAAAGTGPASGQPVEVVISGFTYTPADPSCPGNLDGDGQVTVTDLLAVILDWSGTTADINRDGTVDVSDLLAVILNWGVCPLATSSAAGP